MKQASLSKRLLITGIEGFTGHHLSRYLKKCGYEVYGTTIDETDKEHCFQCDLLDKDAVQSVIDRIQPSYVIHLAAISFVGESNASLIYDVNVIGTCNLLDTLASTPYRIEKVIVASSATVYGNQESEVLDEMMCPRPVNHYGASKHAMECMVSTYMPRIPVIITRPFNYTGTMQAKHFLIPKIVSHFKEQQSRIELGNLDVEREFNDIQDICRMYASLLECDETGETVNLCTGRGISLLDVIALMEEIAGYTIEVTVNPAFVRPNEVKRLVGSTSKLDQMIGGIEITNFKKTLETMYQGEDS